MDFQTLNRRELQALCKLNKIPANITNIAMIDALSSLETVEGIEEFLNSSRSESIDVMSPMVPRTTCRTTTRQKAKKPETESMPATASRASCHGVRRQWAGEVNEVLKTPLVKKETATVQKAYTTRRSTRLTAKKSEGASVIERERSEPVKIDSFLDEVKDLGKHIEENHDVVVLDECDEKSKIEEVVHVDTTTLESGEVENLKVDSVETFEKIEKMDLEDVKPDSEEKPMVIDQKVDLNEALNVPVKEHTDNFIIEAGDIDANALSFDTENPSDTSVLKNEVSEFNGAPFIADDMVDFNSEIPNQTSKLDDHNNIAEGIEENTSENKVDCMTVDSGEVDKLNEEGDVDEVKVAHESSVVDDSFVKEEEDEEYLSEVSDNKENEENMNEKEGDNKSLNDISLRQLKKQLKALTIKNNMDASCVTDN